MALAGRPSHTGARPDSQVNVYVALLIGYSALLTALGLWIARRVRGPADFFVAGRKLTWPYVAATMLAANIGAGATVGATGLAYQQGVSAWFWNGSAALGSLVLAPGRRPADVDDSPPSAATSPLVTSSRIDTGRACA